MDVELLPEPDDPSAAVAVRRAVAGAGLGPTADGAWWRAGLADTLERAPGGPPRPSAYDAVRSPRSTRGATRA